jgi:hypothetical protein
VALGFFTVPRPAQGAVIDLVLGGSGATSWNVTGIKPGDNGVKTVTLHNAGSNPGRVTVWVTDIAETDYAGDGATLDDFLKLNPVGPSLTSSFPLPALVRDLPQGVTDTHSLKIAPLNGGDTVTLDWQWQFPETGVPQNTAQGDSLAFSINYMLEELTPGGTTGGTSGGGAITGGGPAEPEEGGCAPGTLPTTGKINANGTVLQRLLIGSYDQRLTLTIGEGITAGGPGGQTFGCVGINRWDMAPILPLDMYLVGVLYRVTPLGATFSPGAPLKYTYAQVDVPQGVDEQSLYLAYYDSQTGKWVKLESTVDTQANTVTATIGRFNNLGVFGQKQTPPAPASFQAAGLNINPAIVDAGQPVTVTVSVTNGGGQSGTYAVVLKVNGLAFDQKPVTLGAGGSQTVTFTVTETAPGAYTLDVGGLTATFQVRAPVATTPPPANTESNDWLPIAIMALGVALALTLGILLLRNYGKRPQA